MNDKPKRQRKPKLMVIHPYEEKAIEAILSGKLTYHLKYGVDYLTPIYTRGTVSKAVLFGDFASAQKFGNVAIEWMRNQLKILKTDDSERKRVIVYLLKRKGSVQFGLPFNTPVTVMADRFEDVGLTKEAAALRGDIPLLSVTLSNYQWSEDDK